MPYIVAKAMYVWPVGSWVALQPKPTHNEIRFGEK